MTTSSRVSWRICASVWACQSRHRRHARAPEHYPSPRAADAASLDATQPRENG